MSKVRHCRESHLFLGPISSTLLCKGGFCPHQLCCRAAVPIGRAIWPPRQPSKQTSAVTSKAIWHPTSELSPSLVLHCYTLSSQSLWQGAAWAGTARQGCAGGVAAALLFKASWDKVILLPILFPVSLNQLLQTGQWFLIRKKKRPSRILNFLFSLKIRPEFF